MAEREPGDAGPRGDARPRASAITLRGATAAAALVAVTAWLYFRFFDSVDAASLAGCWDHAPAPAANAVRERMQLCLQTEGGRVRFAYDELQTLVTPVSRFLSICHATGTMQIEELRNWRGVFLRRLEAASGVEERSCQTAFTYGRDQVNWHEAPGRLPFCRYDREGDGVVCGQFSDSVLTRRQGAAPRPDDDVCLTVAAAVAAGVLPNERVAQWRQLDADHCAGAARDVVAAAPAAPLPPGSLALSGCYAHALAEDLSETICFEPGGATATRLVRGSSLLTCTSPIVPEQSSPPWQFEFTLVWRCAFSDMPDQRSAERAPLTTRYCRISADGRLTCAYDPRDPGFVYARSSGG